MFVWTFLLRITHTIISRSLADSSWIPLYLSAFVGFGTISNPLEPSSHTTHFTTQFNSKVNILSDNYRLPLTAANTPNVRAVGRVAYVNTTNEKTGSGNLQFSNKIMTPYQPISPKLYVLYACLHVLNPSCAWPPEQQYVMISKKYWHATRMYQNKFLDVCI